MEITYPIPFAWNDKFSCLVDESPFTIFIYNYNSCKILFEIFNTIPFAWNDKFS